MSKDLCQNKDLYLHKELDEIFVFISFRFDITERSKKKRQQAEKKEERPMTIKSSYISNYPWNSTEVDSSILWRTNIVISVKFLNGTMMKTKTNEKRTYISACQATEFAFWLRYTFGICSLSSDGKQ